MNAFQDAVADGTLAPGDRVPTETEIVAALPFALGTVQKALNGLAAQGILNRSRRSGTFVADRFRPLDDMSQYSFERADGTAVTQVRSRVTRCAIAGGDDRCRRILGDCDEGYVRIVRLDEVDGAFTCYGTVLLRADQVGSLTERPLGELAGQNVRTLLSREFGIVVQRLAFASRAIFVPDEIGGQVGLSPGATCLELEVTGFDARGGARFVQTLLVPPVDYRLRMGQ
jgi:GntR family transcriptional regulator